MMLVAGALAVLVLAALILGMGVSAGHLEERELSWGDESGPLERPDVLVSRTATSAAR